MTKIRILQPLLLEKLIGYKVISLSLEFSNKSDYTLTVDLHYSQNRFRFIIYFNKHGGSQVHPFEIEESTLELIKEYGQWVTNELPKSKKLSPILKSNYLESRIIGVTNLVKVKEIILNFINDLKILDVSTAMNMETSDSVITRTMILPNAYVSLIDSKISSSLYSMGSGLLSLHSYNLVLSNYLLRHRAKHLFQSLNTSINFLKIILIITWIVVSISSFVFSYQNKESNDLV